MGFCPSMENLPRRDGGAVVPMVGVLLVPVVTVRFACDGQEKMFEFFKVSVAVGGGDPCSVASSSSWSHEFCESCT